MTAATKFHTCGTAAFILALLMARSPAVAQYSTGFENMTASATGESIWGQEGFRSLSGNPVGHDPVQVFTYANNALGIPQNPNGNSNFIGAKHAPSSLQSYSTRREMDWGAGGSLWSVSYDVLVNQSGASGLTEVFGRFSAYAPGLFFDENRYQSRCSLMPGSLTLWRATYEAYDASGAKLPDPGASPGSAWESLELNHWYRLTTDIDFDTNRIMRVTITDLDSGECNEAEFTDVYLLGGAAGSVRPTGIRFVVNSAMAGSVIGFDNLTVSPGPAVSTCDPCQWSRLLEGMFGTPATVRDLLVFEQGGGPVLYAGGSFLGAIPVLITNNIAAWNGSTWFALGNGIDGEVHALAVYDDGTGPALYAGGIFRNAGGVPADGIAKWDGSAWSPLASFHGAVYSMLVHDDGSGPALFVGGEIPFPGGISRWDGRAWTDLGDGLSPGVRSLAVFDDGSGTKLYAGGDFTRAGQLTVNHIAAWDGTSWSAVGGGTDAPVLELEVFDDGSGPALFAGGDFSVAGGTPTNRIAKWDGAVWSALADGVDGAVAAIKPFSDGSGARLYVGGEFATAGGVGSSSIATWDGSAWRPVHGTDGAVLDLEVFDGGSGPMLHAGGDFEHAGRIHANQIARWGCEYGCYPDCDQSTGAGVLDVFDFLCFQNSFVSAEPYACDCDKSTGNGVCDVFDFLCFQNAFVSGCP